MNNKIETFGHLPLSDKTLKGLTMSGYQFLTDIQKEAIPLALQSLDILGAAKTGSGKTLAFLVPMLELLYHHSWSKLDGIGTVIITPTRELAYQIFEVLKRIGRYHDFSAGLIIGGKDLKFERKRMHHCNIVVGTPGRILQHMDENPLFDCTNLKMLVLDEADRILDLGFAATVNAILDNLPTARQTLLFSATQTKTVQDLARLSLKEAVFVSVHEWCTYTTPSLLQQNFIICPLKLKLDFLWSFLRNHLHQKILVFMSTCKQVKFSFDILCQLRPGMSILALYGTLHQLRRMSIYDEFCRKENVVLLATDVAARGLDFPFVKWVVQYDCPEDSVTYIHRVGRTARYKDKGEAILLLEPSEILFLKRLQDANIPIKEISVNPKKLVSIQKRLQGLLAKNNELKQCANQAFVSYIKSVYLKHDKEIFNVNKTDCQGLAQSYGLVLQPRLRFLKHKQESKLHLPAPHNSNENTSDNCSSDDEMFKVKNCTYNLEGNPDLYPVNENKKKKVITKAALAKKILKKKIYPSKHSLFDEEGNLLKDVCHPQITNSKSDENSQGLDIAVAMQSLQQEDVVDKHLFRQRIRNKHRKKRLKYKAQNKNENFSSNDVENKHDFEQKYNLHCDEELALKLLYK